MRRYLTPRCLGMHLTLAVVLPVFAWLTWWQLDRATHGNTLSWAYTFEWPLFAAYACYVWWQLIHDEPAAIQRRRAISATGDHAAGPQDEVGWALESARDRRRRGRPDGRPDITGSGTASDPGDPVSEPVEEEDSELAEYNRYLAELNAGPDPRKW